MKGLSEQRRDGHFLERNETLLSITLYYETRFGLLFVYRKGMTLA